MYSMWLQVFGERKTASLALTMPELLVVKCQAVLSTGTAAPFTIQQINKCVLELYGALISFNKL